MIYVLRTDTHRQHRFAATHYAYFTDEGAAFDAIEALADTARERVTGNVLAVYYELMECEAGQLFTTPTVTRAGRVQVNTHTDKPRTDARD